MGIISRPQKVKLIVGLIFSDCEKYSAIKDDLAKIFGGADFESESFDFTRTTYYTDEMGPGLKRRFLSFERLLDLNNIYAVKIRTNRIEMRYADEGKRTVNIDPGYLNLSKLVLFSTKDYSHRIYLGGGIFSELTLSYRDDEFNPLPWTYPDYRTKEYRDIFSRIRQIYKRQLKSG